MEKGYFVGIIFLSALVLTPALQGQWMLLDDFSDGDLAFWATAGAGGGAGNIRAFIGVEDSDQVLIIRRLNPASGEGAIHVDRSPSPKGSTHDDIGLRFRFKLMHENVDVWCYLRGHHSYRGYQFGTYGSGNGLFIQYQDDNWFQQILASESAQFQINQYYWMEVNALGSNLSMKCWVDGSPEPDEPQLTAEHSLIPSGNTIGMETWSNPPTMADVVFDDVYIHPPQSPQIEPQRLTVVYQDFAPMVLESAPTTEGPWQPTLDLLREKIGVQWVVIVDNCPSMKFYRLRPGTYFSDDFHSGNHFGWELDDQLAETPWGPTILDTSSGALQIASTESIPSAESTPVTGVLCRESLGNPLFADGTARATVIIDNASTSATMRFRYNPDAGTGYEVTLTRFRGRGFQLQLSAVNGDSRIELGLEDTRALKLGVEYFLTIRAVGPELTAKLREKSLDCSAMAKEISVSDATWDSGGLGLGIFHEQSNEKEIISARFDDVYFFPVESGP